MRIDKRALALVAVVAIAAPVVTGCGEDQTFIDDYNEATEPLQKLNTDIGGAVNSDSTDPGAVAKQFNTLAATAEEVNGNLADLEAPDDAKKDFDDLKAGLKSTEQHLKDVAAAAKRGQELKAAQAAQALIDDSAKITKAENAVAAKVEN